MKKYSPTAILLRSGIVFDLADPKAEDVDIRDIAYSLARTQRFNGHLFEGDSVARHSIRVMRAVDREFYLDALLHDASEAYIGDVTRPMKIVLGDSFREFENRIASVVAEAFGLQWPVPPEVKKADDRDCYQAIQRNLEKNPGEHFFQEVPSNVVEDQREFLRIYGAVLVEREQMERGYERVSRSPVIHGGRGRR